MSFLRQARIANKGGCTALMKRIMRHAPVSDPQGLNAECAEKTCLALSAVLLYPTTHEKMTGLLTLFVLNLACTLLCTLYIAPHLSVIGGLEESIRLCKECHDPLLLRALCKIIVSMVPDPDDLVVREQAEILRTLSVHLINTMTLLYCFSQRVHEDDNKYPVEKFNALPVLKKAKFKGYAHLPK